MAILGSDGSLKYGAHTLAEIEECPHRLTMDVSVPVELQDKPSERLQMVFDEGNDYEAVTSKAMADACVAAGLQFLHVEAKTTAEAFELTKAALAQGIDVIANARLEEELSPDERLVGYADFLVKESKPGEHPRYVPLDTKAFGILDSTKRVRTYRVAGFLPPVPPTDETAEHPGRLKRHYAIQLSHYYRLLTVLGHQGSAIGALLSPKYQHALWFDLTAKVFDKDTKSPIDIWSEALAEGRRLAVYELDRADTDAQLTHPEFNAGLCKECRWFTQCMTTLKTTDHVSLVPGVSPKTFAAHYAAGVTSRAQLARLDNVTAYLVDKKVDLPRVVALARTSAPADNILPELSEDDQKALRKVGWTTAGDVITKIDPKTAHYASGPSLGSSLIQAIDQARALIEGKILFRRDRTRLDMPQADVEIDLDVENIAGHMYLIGFRKVIYQQGKHLNWNFVPFYTWEGTEEAEASTFVAAWTWLVSEVFGAQRAGKSVRVYVYSHHEASIFRSTAEKYQDWPQMPTPEQVDEFTHSDVWCDLYALIKEQLVFPAKSYSIKDLINPEEWEDEAPGGGNSVAWYMALRQAVIDKDLAKQKEIGDRILAYNKDDVKVMRLLRERIWKASKTRGDGRIIVPSSLDAKYKPQRRLRVRSSRFTAQQQLPV